MRGSWPAARINASVLREVPQFGLCQIVMVIVL
jgi:hypothetical protein